MQVTDIDDSNTETPYPTGSTKSRLYTAMGDMKVMDTEITLQPSPGLNLRQLASNAQQVARKLKSENNRVKYKTRTNQDTGEVTITYVGLRIGWAPDEKGMLQPVYA